MPATITLTASGSTDEGGIELPEHPEPPGGGTGGGGNNNPEPLDPVNFTVTPAQVVEYTYNVRSWTNKIYSHHLEQDLTYGYNGNISTFRWRMNDQIRKYTYTYDNLSRLKTAAYTGIGSEQYGTSYSYDKHGNIKTLQRYGKKDTGNAATSYGLIDSLTFDYTGTGNQLRKVTDAVPNFAYIESADFKNYGGSNAIYTYNLNGAMATDSHKGILGIKYNSLNLPYELLIKNVDISGKVYYTYSASGVKLKTRHLKAKNLGYTPVTGTAGDTNLDVAKTTDYVGNKVYEDGTLKRVLVDGGYIEGGVYHYYLTDHLGNNRIVANASGTVIQKNHYYPFGTAFADKYDNGSKQPYKYNGKELDQMHGLNLYDYSARYYESAIGRFTTVDPLAEIDYNWSPYVYCDNNPIRFIDPDGMKKGDPDDPYELPEVVVTPKPIEVGDQVLPAESGWWNLWYQIAGPREYIEYSTHDGVGYYKKFSVYASGKVYNVITNPPITGTPMVPAWGKALKASSVIKSIKGASKSRVFWSGGEKAKQAAEAFAKSNGQTTLEMTRAGQNMEKLTNGMPWSQASSMWQRISSTYANGVKSGSSIHVFQNAETGVGLNSVWRTIEYPILQSKGVNIIYHSVP